MHTAHEAAAANLRLRPNTGPDLLRNRRPNLLLVCDLNPAATVEAALLAAGMEELDPAGCDAGGREIGGAGELIRSSCW